MRRSRARRERAGFDADGWACFLRVDVEAQPSHWRVKDATCSGGGSKALTEMLSAAMTSAKALTGMLAAASISAIAFTGMLAAASASVKSATRRLARRARSSDHCARSKSRDGEVSHPISRVAATASPPSELLCRCCRRSAPYLQMAYETSIGADGACLSGRDAASGASTGIGSILT